MTYRFLIENTYMCKNVIILIIEYTYDEINHWRDVYTSIVHFVISPNRYIYDNKGVTLMVNIPGCMTEKKRSHIAIDFMISFVDGNRHDFQIRNEVIKNYQHSKGIQDRIIVFGSRECTCFMCLVNGNEEY